MMKLIVLVMAGETFTSQVKVCKLHLFLPENHHTSNCSCVLMMTNIWCANDDGESSSSSGSPEENIFKLDVPAGESIKVWGHIGCVCSTVFLPVSDSQGVEVTQSREKLPDNMEASKKETLLVFQFYGNWGDKKMWMHSFVVLFVWWMSVLAVQSILLQALVTHGSAKNSSWR